MNSRQRKLEEAYQRCKEACEFQRKKEEEARKKSELISSFHSARFELSNKCAKIQSRIDSCIKEHTQRLEATMRNFVVNLKENPSTELPQFQIHESFMRLLSDSNLRLEEISEQMKVIDSLIQTVSSNSPDISLSEQKIIKILSANSFFKSQDVASVQKMIDSCSNMRVCLEHLRTYSETFISKMEHEISSHKKKPEDFTVDPKRLELEHRTLEELLQELSELNEEIEKRKFLFSTNSLVECIFSIKPDEFLSISEDTQTLEDRIKEMNKRFSEIKKSLVEFVESQIFCRQAFVRDVHHRGGYNSGSDGENDSKSEEPTGDLRKILLESFEQIRRRRV